MTPDTPTYGIRVKMANCANHRCILQKKLHLLPFHQQFSDKGQGQKEVLVELNDKIVCRASQMFFC